MFAFEPLIEDDLPFLLDVRNECRAMLHNDRAFTLPECQAWFRERRPEFFVIRLDGERIGYFRLSHRDAADRSIYVGADLHKDYRGRNLARPAYEAFLARLRDHQHIAIAKLEVLSHNIVAHRLYTKMGFREIDRKKSATVRNGESVDSILMSKTL